MSRFTPFLSVAALLATVNFAVAQVTTFAGGGAFVPGRAATVGSDDVYFTDPVNHVVRRFNIPTGALQTFSGVAGKPGDAEGTASNGRVRRRAPQGICHDGARL